MFIQNRDTGEIMMPDYFYLLIIVLSITGFGDGISILGNPKDATEIIGESATFTCVTDLGLNPAMSWEHSHERIYSFMNGLDDYLDNHSEKYQVSHDGSTFNLTVKHLDCNDAGIYTCRVITGQSEASLVILDEPYISTDPGESGQINYFCNARFAGPNEDVFPDQHFPKLRMFIDHHFQFGETKISVERSERGLKQYHLSQAFKLPQRADMKKMQLTCGLHTSDPPKSTNNSTAEVVPSSPNTPHKSDFQIQHQTDTLNVVRVVVIICIAVLLLVFFIFIGFIYCKVKDNPYRLVAQMSDGRKVTETPSINRELASKMRKMSV